MSELRIYAACLASYNNGTLHGAWIDVGEIADCVTGRDTGDIVTIVQAKINEMLRQSRYPNVQRQDCECSACRKSWTRTLHYDPAADRPPTECSECGGPVECGPVYHSAEEWAIHDYDGTWPSGMGEYPGLETIAAWAVLLQEAEEDHGLPAEVVKGLASHHGDPSNGSDPFRYTRDSLENFSGAHADLGAWAEELESECGELANVPERLRLYIDFDSIGRDARLGGDILDIEHDGQVYVFWNH